MKFKDRSKLTINIEKEILKEFRKIMIDLEKSADEFINPYILKIIKDFKKSDVSL